MRLYLLCVTLQAGEVISCCSVSRADAQPGCVGLDGSGGLVVKNTDTECSYL